MNYYSIDFAREHTMYGPETSFITIQRSDININPESTDNNYDVYGLVFPNCHTFTSYGTFIVDKIENNPSGSSRWIITMSYNFGTNNIGFNNIKEGLIIKDSINHLANIGIDKKPIDHIIIQKILSYNITNIIIEIDVDPLVWDFVMAPGNIINVGSYDREDNTNWEINGKSLKELEIITYSPTNDFSGLPIVKNIFDGTVNNIIGNIFAGTQYHSRIYSGWLKLPFDPEYKHKSVSIRIDYNGKEDAHLGLRMCIFKIPKDSNGDPIPALPGTTAIAINNLLSTFVNENNPIFGINTCDELVYATHVDTQETHFFGYKTDYKSINVDNYNGINTSPKLYDNYTSYMLLKTNPKLSGNVKITIDSSNNIWLNSFDANSELSNAKYKKWRLKGNGVYSNDLYRFWDNGNTPTNIVYDLYEADPIYESTKREQHLEFDNFYNAGPEQLYTKYYLEQYTYLAPLWLRDTLPDYFIILKIDKTQTLNNIADTIGSSNIIASYSLGLDSEIGKYINGIKNDNLQSHCLTVNYEENVPTLWRGIDYKTGTVCEKIEYLYEYYKSDKSIIEFEEYVTLGFERNGLICNNLINLEFLFNDTEAIDHTMYRYVGLYASENELCNFNIDSSKIEDTNPFDENVLLIGDNIQLPIHLGKDSINGPHGKIPLREFVLDTNRFFYIKDKLNGLEKIVDIFNDTLYINKKSKDAGKYLGVDKITFQAESLQIEQSYSYCDLYLNKIGSNNIFAENEELIIENTGVTYNHENLEYTVVLTGIISGKSTFEIFKNVETSNLLAGFIQPSVGSSITISVNNPYMWQVEQQIWISNGGIYTVSSRDSVLNTITIINSSINNVVPSTPVAIENIIAKSLPTYRKSVTYILNSVLVIDSSLSIKLNSTIAIQSYRINIENGLYNITLLSGVVKNIDVITTKNTECNRWKLIASSNGLQIGDYWNYPVYDIESNTWVTQFNPNGLLQNVQSAIIGAINSFAYGIIEAKAESNIIKLRSKTNGASQNSILFTRKIVADSVPLNCGFFNDCNITQNITILPMNYNQISNIMITINPYYFNAIGNSYYIKIWKYANLTIISIRNNVDTSSIITASSTGTLHYIYNSEVIRDNKLPFILDSSNLGLGVYEFVYIVNITDQYQQYFIGATNNILHQKTIVDKDLEIFQNAPITITGIITNNIIESASSIGLQIGDTLLINGIPTTTTIIDIFFNTIYLSSNIESGSIFTFKSLGVLTGLKWNFWFKTQLRNWSHLEKWSVGNKYQYIIKDWDNRYILTIDNKFLTNSDNIIIAYDLYRTSLGIFSIFPIKSFDWNHFKSKYAYTPLVECFQYYINEDIKNGEYFYTEPYNDWIITPNGRFDPFNIIIEVLWNDKWYNIETLYFQNYTNNVHINLDHPLYRYDPNENPLNAKSINSNILGYGLGNFYRSIMTDGNGNNVKPSKYRLCFNTSSEYITHWNIKSVYSTDLDLLKFRGFSGLKDINTLEDIKIIQTLIDSGEYIDAFSNTLLQSEYLRLREPYTKELCLKSKVVPWINKWSSEGSDCRDNKYRLNISSAFGLSNFSPDDNIRIKNPELFTHEFPYIDGIPKNYPVDSINILKSYTYNRLNEIVDGETWFNKLTSNIEFDWFSKFFINGTPTILDNESIIITKKEEKYTHFKRVIDDTYTTLFRGAKIQINDTKNDLSKWKFAAIYRSVPVNPYEKSVPYSINFYKNVKWKNILMIITIRINDYRILWNLDYTYLYAATDQLQKQAQKQSDFKRETNNGFGLSLSNSLTITDFLPYSTSAYIDTNNMSILKPRQGYFGSGTLELANVKLPVFFNEPHVPIVDRIDFKIIDNLQYPFIFSSDISPIKNSYKKKNIYKSFSKELIDGSFVNSVIDSNFIITDGSLFKFISTFKNQQRTKIVHIDKSNLGDSIKILSQSIEMSTPIQPIVINNDNTTGADQTICNTLTTGFISVLSVYDQLETWNIKGGTNAAKTTLDLLSYANIIEYVNTKSDIIYQSVDNAIIIDMDIKFIKSDSIIKNELYTVDDNDRPIEYINQHIGYNIENSERNTIVNRHRGEYQPLANDIVHFQTREDTEFAAYYNNDFCLHNTKLLNSNDNGNIEYSINKIAKNEILKISRDDSYKSLYPVVDEISIDNKTQNVFNSNWDKDFYREYWSNNKWDVVNGFSVTTEIKTWIGKLLKVPDTVSIEIFNKIAFNVKDNTIEIGINILDELLSYLLDNTSESFTNIGALNEYTTEQITLIKRGYYQSNILKLYELSNIELWQKTSNESMYTNIDVDTRIVNRWTKTGYVSNNSKKLLLTKEIDSKQLYQYAVTTIWKRI